MTTTREQAYQELLGDNISTPTTVTAGRTTREQAYRELLGEALPITDAQAAQTGRHQAAHLNSLTEQYPNASPKSLYQHAQRYRTDMEAHYRQQGYDEAQRQALLQAFNTQAKALNPTDGTALTYLTDPIKTVGKGAMQFADDVISAFAPNSTIAQEFRTATKAYDESRSAESQIKELKVNQAIEQDIANGENEAWATLKHLVTNPSQIGNMALSELVPTLATAGVGLATRSALAAGGLNAVRSVGDFRREVMQSWQALPRDEALAKPEIQSRMKAGMTFEEALNDVSTDVSEHLWGIVRATGIGLLDSFNPINRLGNNAGVATTFIKEMGLEAGQGGLEQLNKNATIGEIDGKTGLLDGVQRAAVTEGLAATPYAAVSAADAYLNGKQKTQYHLDDQGDSTLTQTQPTTVTVNKPVLENILGTMENEFGDEKETILNELIDDIEQGRLSEAMASEDTAYANAAKAYAQAVGSQAESAKISASDDIDVKEAATEANLNTGLDNSALNANLADTQQDNLSDEYINPSRDEWLQEVRFSRAYQDGEDKVSKANVLQGVPVAEINNVEVNLGSSKERVEWATKIIEPFGGTVHNPELGEIIINRRSVKDTLQHGYQNAVKMKSFYALKDVIEKGVVIAKAKHDKMQSFIISAPVRIDGMDYIANVTVRQDHNPAKMYVHSVMLKEKLLANAPGVETVSELDGNKVSLGDVQQILSELLHYGNDGKFSDTTDVNSAGSVDTKKTTQSKPTLTRQGMGAVGNEHLSDGELSVGNDTTKPTHQETTLTRQMVGASDVAHSTQPTPNVNSDTAQAQAILRQALGEHAEHIELVRTAELNPNDPNYAGKAQNEGWFENGKLQINLDNIAERGVLSREQNLIWVAWHELAHQGIAVKFAPMLRNILTEARRHPMVRLIAERHQKMHGTALDEATEEALAEIFAAQQSNRWTELQQRYGIRLHPSQTTDNQGLAKHLALIARGFKHLIGIITGKPMAEQSDQALFDILAKIKQGIAESLPNSTASETDSVAENAVRYSLNENADSAFARAVDSVAGGATLAKYINVGTTPDVLQMLGLPDVRVTISGEVLNKVMNGKHNVMPETLKQLPKQINDPVAVMKSETQPNAYVVLTELTERENGRDKPVIAALHLKRSKQGLELINIASVYGRSNSQIQRGLENDLLYWNKTKGSQFITAFGLQLPSHMQPNANLSARNIKTEADLSQYRKENSIRFSRTEDLSEAAYNQAKAEGKTELTFNQWKQVRSPEFKRWFGDWEHDPANASKVVNPKTGEPLVVYHGSNAEFNVFNQTGKTDAGWYGRGFYFAQDSLAAEMYAEHAVSERGGKANQFAVYLNLKNPKYLNIGNVKLSETIAKSLSKADNITQTNKANGYDGVVVFDNPNGNQIHFIEELIAFDANQIKSATDNTGEFSAENEDIRFSRAAQRTKAESLEKLRQSETIRILGTEIEPSEDLRQYKRNALEYGKSLRGTYVNKDTGREISLGLGAIKEVLQHDYKNPNHLQSVAAIPQIIENAIYIDTVQNEDVEKNPNIESYDYYLTGINIGGKDYTARAVIANANTGERYYDHKLSEIEKGDLLSTAGITNPSFDNSSPLSAIDDKRLLQILQDNSDANIRYSRPPSVLEQLDSGEAYMPYEGIWEELRQGHYKKAFQQSADAFYEASVDETYAIDRWAKSMPIEPETAEALVSAKDRAEGIRMDLNARVSVLFIKPLMKNLVALDQKHRINDLLFTKHIAQYWYSARYSMEKNLEILQRERQAMLDAQQALSDAKKNGDPEEIQKAARAERRATRQYKDRHHDVYLNNWQRDADGKYLDRLQQTSHLSDERFSEQVKQLNQQIEQVQRKRCSPLSHFAVLQ